MKNYDKNTSAWFGNVPGDFFTGVPQDFSVTKNDIVSIHFTDTLKDMPDSAWDISAAAGKVMAWVLPADELFIDKRIQAFLSEIFNPDSEE